MECVRCGEWVREAQAAVSPSGETIHARARECPVAIKMNEDVHVFATLMMQLFEKHWQLKGVSYRDASLDFVMSKLPGKLVELSAALDDAKKGVHHRNVSEEAGDLANLAMIVWTIARREGLL